MTGFRTPNFRDRHAIILHKPGDSIDRLVRQLERLGMKTGVHWPDFPADGSYADVIFFDADNAFDELFPWAPGAAPMPLVALLGSELPGRLEWAMRQGVSSHVVKPVQSSGVFSALVIAFANFEAARETQRLIDALTARLDGRPAVIRAVVALMAACGIDDTAAYARIRSAAMARRVTVEDFCATLDPGAIDRLFADQANPRKQTR